MDVKKLGRNIKREMLRNGYSVKDIQRKLKLSCPQSIYKWYRGESTPSAQHLYELNRLFNCKIDDFFKNVGSC